MKKNIKANTKLIQGSILYLRGVLTGNRKDKVKGLSKYLEGSALKKVDRLMK